MAKSGTKAVVIGALILSVVLACSKPNQRSPVSSDNGEYRAVLSMDTVEYRLVLNGTKQGRKWSKQVWALKIEEPDANVLFESTLADLSGAHAGYWAWDAQNRFWLYHSDAGTVYRWSRSKGLMKVASVCAALSKGAPTAAFPSYALNTPCPP